MYRDDYDTERERRFDKFIYILNYGSILFHSFSALDDRERTFVWNDKGKNKSHNLLLIDSLLNVVALACDFTVGGIHVQIFLKLPSGWAAIALN